MGVSVLLPTGTNELEAVIRFGEYLKVEHDEGYTGPQHWQRIPREEVVSVKIGSTVPDKGVVLIPNSRGVELAWSARGVPDTGIDGGLPKGTRSLSLFVVNRRKASPDDVRDEGFIFQAELELNSDSPFIARPNLRSLESNEWDARNGLKQVERDLWKQIIAIARWRSPLLESIRKRLSVFSALR
jgi:hypothetical protein